MEPIQRAQELIAQADALLVKGQFKEAAQMYAEAHKVFVQAGDPQKARLLAGLQNQAAALEAYWDDQYPEAIAHLEKSESAFAESGYEDLREFTRGLHLAFQAEQASDDSKFRTALKMLSAADVCFNAVRVRSKALAPSCEFWLRWTRLLIELDMLDHGIDQENIGALRVHHEKISSLARQLIELADGAAEAKAYYEGIVSLASAGCSLAKAGRALGLLGFQRAAVHIEEAQRSASDAAAQFKDCASTPKLHDMEGSLEFVRVLLAARKAEISARAKDFAGDRVAAIREMKAGIAFLTQKRAAACKTSDILADWVSEIEDELRNSQRFLARISARDPGLDVERDAVEQLCGPEGRTVKEDLDNVANAFMHRQWLSVLVLCGAVLEGILYHLTQTQAEKAATWPRAPKDADKKPKPLEEWELGQLLPFAENVGILRKGDADISSALKNFRNLIHPGRRIRLGFVPSHAEAAMAISTLRVIIHRLVDLKK